MIVLAYLAIAILVFAALAALGRKRPMTREEYDARRNQGGGPGNALLRSAGAGMLELQGILEPGREQIRRAKEERTGEEDESGDPPEPGDASRPFRAG
jgi:hypothetical protein